MTDHPHNRQIGVRVDDELYEALKRDADEHGRTVSQTVRHLLRKTFLASA